MRLSKANTNELIQAHDALISFLSDHKKVREILSDPKGIIEERLGGGFTVRKGIRLFKLPKIGVLESEVYVSVDNKGAPKYVYFREASQSYPHFDYNRVVYFGSFAFACGKLVYSPNSLALFKRAINDLLQKNAKIISNFHDLSSESTSKIQSAIDEKYANRLDNRDSVLCSISEANRGYNLVVKKVEFKSSEENKFEHPSFQASFYLTRADGTPVSRIGIFRIFANHNNVHTFDIYRLRRAIRSKILKDLITNKLVVTSSLTAKYSF